MNHGMARRRHEDRDGLPTAALGTTSPDSYVAGRVLMTGWAARCRSGSLRCQERS
jgi:hypothetical protein